MKIKNKARIYFMNFIVHKMQKANIQFLKRPQIPTDYILSPTILTVVGKM